MSAAGVLAATWKKRAPWEPVVDDIPNGPQRVGGLLSALGIALLWGNRSNLDTASLTNAAIVLGIVCGVSLLFYVLLVTSFVYVKKVAVGPQQVRDEKIVGGFWLLPGVIQHRKGRTLQRILETREHDPDAIWSRLSRALVKICFILAYFGLSAGGTVALAAASLLVGHSVR
jgi:hypothetical protein